MRGPTRLLLTLLTPVLLLGGCGSKISEANYYRIQYGMTEDDVDDLLGPPREETTIAAAASTSPSTTRTAARKIKTWTRGGLTIRVEFENGVVVGRSSAGIAGETPATRRSNVRT